MAQVALPIENLPAGQSTSQIDIKCDQLESPTDSGVGSSKCTPTSDGVLFSDAQTSSIEELDEGQGETDTAERGSIDSYTEDATLPASSRVMTPAMKDATNGPDEIIEADSVVTWHRNEAVKLRMQSSGPLSEKPISLPTLLLNASRNYADKTALAVKRNGDWVKWNYQDYYKEVRTVAKAFIKLGLERYNAVGIMGFNSPEWFFSSLGCIFAGGLAVGIYTTNTPEATKYVAEISRCNVIVVENDQLLQKVLQVWDQLPHLKAIVQYIGEPKEKIQNVYSWKEVAGLAKGVSDDALNDRLRNQAVNKPCALIFTSGTTGNPKGVMLSHDNVTWTASMAVRSVNLRVGEISISYLPLSHIAAQVVDIYAPIVCGSTVYFAQPDALKGSLTGTMREVRPTVFLGVPRVWEKIEEKMRDVGRSTGGIKKRIATWAKSIGYRGNMSLQRGGSLPFGWTLANALVFKKVRAALGLDRCRMCVTSAAPITKETLDYFLALNIPILENYGMSECTGPHTISTPWKYMTTSVGVDLTGVSTILDNQDDEGNGEICLSGRHIFMGYLDMEDKTKEAIDEEGLLHSGDIGRKDKDGFIYITGRIKELIITAGGENVAPVIIEDTVREELPCVSNCMLIGDKKKFLSVLLTLRTTVDMETMLPTEKLNPTAIAWCHSVGSSATTLSDILNKRDEKVLKALQAGIDRANERAISRAQKIQKWSVLPHDFSIPGGELGPTMKLKRPVVVNMYQKTIDAFYE